jgi:hypothetical protein
MKKLLFLLMALSIIGVVNAGNLLVNGNFESTTGAGWTQWWGGNSNKHVADPIIAGNYCAGIWWMDDGLFQKIAIGPGIYEFGGRFSHGGLGNNRIALIKAEIGDGTSIWWSQEIVLDQNDPTGNWLSGNGVIDNSATGATQIQINLFLYDRNGWGSGVGIARFDNIYLGPQGISKQAKFPVPANGLATVSPVTSSLKWSNPDPNNPADTISCTVYLEPQDGDPNFHTAPIAAGVTTGTVSVSLLPATTYTWRVDATDPHGDPNTRGPVTTQGDVWTFTTTNDNPPVVNAGDDKYLWLNMNDGDGDPAKVTFTLAGQLTDDGISPVTTLWSLIYSEQDPATVVAITNPAALTTSVTINGTGLYTFRLDANDAYAHAEDTVTVVVFGSACEAANGDPTDIPANYPNGTGDINGDCKINLDDFAIMAGTWLDCLSTKLVCP